MISEKNEEIISKQGSDVHNLGLHNKFLSEANVNDNLGFSPLKGRGRRRFQTRAISFKKEKSKNQINNLCVPDGVMKLSEMQ